MTILDFVSPALTRPVSALAARHNAEYLAAVVAEAVRKEPKTRNWAHSKIFASELSQHYIEEIEEPMRLNNCKPFFWRGA